MTEPKRNMILDEVVRNTYDFIANVPKSQRKKYGQFFTSASTARFMADLFNIDFKKNILNYSMQGPVQEYSVPHY